MLQRETTAGVLRFRLSNKIFGQGGYFTACYWVDGLLIDSGCAHTARELDAALADHRLQQIVNTHSHEDHFGGNARLVRRHGARVLAHPAGLEVMAAPRRHLKMQLYRHVFWGVPERSLGERIGEVVHTKHHRFEVIATPGHSVDHIALFERERGWLFTGDAFVGGRDRALRGSADVRLIIDSMETMAALDARLMFVGSGRVYQEPSAQLQVKIDYLRELGERIMRLRRRGASVSRIHRLLFKRRPFVSYLTSGDFTGEHLVRSYLQSE
ncbi:MAG: MBL fold metallo-hydrolase [Deltaproteobacteria bacterium]|nr:MBL fold metallo-hydrolase [Deltaproteobacteria bacterium]